MTMTMLPALRCQMHRDCDRPVAWVDVSGWVYCAEHGRERSRTYTSRKVKAWELARLQRGETISY